MCMICLWVGGVAIDVQYACRRAVWLWVLYVCAFVNHKLALCLGAAFHLSLLRMLVGMQQSRIRTVDRLVRSSGCGYEIDV
jgi:hypothetical protein